MGRDEDAALAIEREVRDRRMLEQSSLHFETEADPDMISVIRSFLDSVSMDEPG